MARKRLTLDNALTPQEWEIRKAALQAAYGEKAAYIPEPKEPNRIEKGYERARELFGEKRTSAGYDRLDSADRSALLRLGRANRKGRR